MYEWVCIQFSPTLLHVVLARTMYEWVCISVLTHSAPCGVGQDYVWMSMHFSSHPLCSMWCRPGLCMNEYAFQFSPTLLHVVLARTMYEWVCISVITHSAPCGVGQDYVWMSMYFSYHPLCSMWCRPGLSMNEYAFSSHPLCSMWCRPGLCMNEYVFQFSPTLLHVV